MGVLSDLQTQEALKEGRVIIHPFDEANLNTSSYDIRLGRFYYIEHKPSVLTRLRSLLTPGMSVIFNPYDKDHVDNVWGKGIEFQEAKTAREIFSSTRWRRLVWRFKYTGISPNDLIVLVGPRRTILAHSEEFIGGVEYHTSMMKARSSWGRSFVEVCKCAGWGDVGFFNRWTMEITNNSYWYSIPLVVGRRIAQITFLETGAIKASLDYSKEGKYQSSANLEDVIKNWHPQQMLPQLWKDRDIQS